MKKICITLVMILVICVCVSMLVACQNPSSPETPENPSGSPSHTHSYKIKYDSQKHWKECACGEKEGESAHSGGVANCIQKATCSVCNQEYGDFNHDVETYASDDTNHWYNCKNCEGLIDLSAHSYVDGACVCGKCVYVKVDEDTILFGSYPQTLVSDEALISKLNAKASPRPTSRDSWDWTSYGYYMRSKVEDYMWYIDIEYEGEKYRGVYLTEYRPFYTYYSTLENPYNKTQQDDNGYSRYEEYWFKYEPISWTILDEEKGLILCDMILDAQEYYAKSYSHTIDGVTIYPNNYEHSNIRAWLNGTFYDTALKGAQEQIIKATLVDNSLATTGDTENKYVCSDTNDKVFLLSYQDVTNVNYGFISDIVANPSRQKKTTDYAEIQGAFSSKEESKLGVGCWWLRSPADYKSSCTHAVQSGGDLSYSDEVCDLIYGVVPALQIQL